jgi:hypothetical protein
VSDAPGNETTSAATDALDMATAEAAEAFAAAGIDCMLLKGAAIERVLYDGAQRAYTDADLLIRPTASATAEDILLQLGFERHEGDRSRDDEPRQSHVWERGQDGAVIDLAWSLPGVSTAADRVWTVLSSRAERIVVGRSLVLAPGPAAIATIVAINAARHGPHADKPLEDLDRAIHRLSPEVWTAAARMATELGAIAWFAAGLRLLPAGEDVAEALGLPPTQSVEVALRAKGARSTALGFERLARTAGVRGKVAYLGRTLVPPKRLMKDSSPLARRGRLALALAYLWHALRLPWTAVPGLRIWLATRKEVDPAGSPLALLRPLALFHPKGFAERFLVVGTGLGPSEPPNGHPVDFAAIVPNASELRQSNWLDAAVQGCVSRLAPEGILCVLVPAGGRRRAKKALQRHSLVATPVVHLPSWRSTRYLIPLGREPLAYGISRVVIGSEIRRSLILGALRVPQVPAMLASIFPSVSLVARRAHARPPAAWLLEDLGAGSAVIRSGRRESAVRAVVHAVAADGRSALAAAKLRSRSEAEAEAAALRRVAPAARGAGAEVPRPLALKELGNAVALVETAINGRLAVAFLAGRPWRAANVISRIRDWIAEWHAATLSVAPRTTEQLRRDVLVAAATIAPLIENGVGYAERLERLCADVARANVRLASAHNDLTMWNVVVGEDGRLGILDWEEARENELPLGDLVLAIADAHAAPRRYTDRLGTLSACFRRDGSPAGPLGEPVEQLRCEFEIPRQVAELSFHATWLHQAAKAVRIDAPWRPDFLEIVQWLASDGEESRRLR